MNGHTDSTERGCILAAGGQGLPSVQEGRPLGKSWLPGTPWCSWLPAPPRMRQLPPLQKRGPGNGSCQEARARLPEASDVFSWQALGDE